MRIGLVGLGRWGANWLRTLHAHPTLEIAAICDTDGAALARAAAATAAPTFSDPAALFAAGVEAVVLATPAETHAPLAIRALGAGLHVLVEKPLATTLEAADAVVQAAARARRVCGVGHLTLHHDAFDGPALGSIGRVERVLARRTSLGAMHTAESAIFGLASHDVATLLGPLGLRALRVRARSLSADRPDQAVVVELVLERGRDVVLGELTASRLGPDRVRALEVIGSAGVFRFDERASEPPGGLLRKQCDAFVAHVGSGRRSLREVTLAADVVRVLVAAERSLATGGAWLDAARRPQEPILGPAFTEERAT